jgi:hypothetical protein
MQARAFRSLNRDGLLEILAGFTFLVCSAFVANTALFPLLFVPVLVLAPGLKWLRSRFVHPRIGYARLPDDLEASQGRGILGFTVAVFFLYVLALVGFGGASDVAYWRKWAAALAGALCSGGFLFLARRSGFIRYYLYIAASLVGGVAFSLIQFERPYQNVQMLLLALAALMLVSGGWIFVRFLAANPLPEAANAEADT